MAGGLGARLKPFTNIIPKPLLLYKGKTIIENVIDFYSNHNVSFNFTEKKLKKIKINNYGTKVENNLPLNEKIRFERFKILKNEWQNYNNAYYNLKEAKEFIKINNINNI